MKIILLVLGIFVGGFGKSVAQDTVRSFVVEMDANAYKFENTTFFAPNVMGLLITPKGDTIIMANRSYYSEERAKGPFGNCIYSRVNPQGLGIDSVKLYLALPTPGDSAEAGVVWFKKLEFRGHSEAVMATFPLPHGDLLKIREVYRRQYECTVHVWFELMEGKSNAP